MWQEIEGRTARNPGKLTMSDAVAVAVAALNERLGGGGIEGTVRIVIEDEGSLIVDEAGVPRRRRRGRLHADGERRHLSATCWAAPSTRQSAFMGGRLIIDGDMGLAMRLASLLA